MKLLTKAITAKLQSNYESNQIEEDINQMPVVKLFGGSACTWLLSELDEYGVAFGLCDLGFGSPELGSVSIAELEEAKFPPFGLGVERDKLWKPKKSLDAYADEARIAGHIVS